MDRGRGGYRGGGRGGGGRPPTNPDDWICANCQNRNYARRSECHRCNEPRNGAPAVEGDSARPVGGGRGGFGGGRGGAAAADRGRFDDIQRGPIFGPDDWKCDKCGNVNWAKRTMCNVCRTSRHTGPVEKREGRGGGFNERQDVQYKARREDDGDKYDDMGRLKKQYRPQAALTQEELYSRSRQGNGNGPDVRSRSPPRDRGYSPQRHYSPVRGRSRSPPRDYPPRPYSPRQPTSYRPRSPPRQYERRYSPRRSPPRSYERPYSPPRTYERPRSPPRDYPPRDYPPRDYSHPPRDYDYPPHDYSRPRSPPRDYSSPAHAPAPVAAPAPATIDVPATSEHFRSPSPEYTRGYDPNKYRT